MNIFFIDLVEGISNTFGKVDYPTRLRSSLGWWKQGCPDQKQFEKEELARRS